MTTRTIQIHLGAGACILALFLFFVGIPTWVSSPSNVSNVVLSPTFWPYILTAFTALAGMGLLVSARQSAPDDSPEDDTTDPQALYRLAALAAIMVVTMFALPRLGMVWTCMLVFAATAFLFRTRHPKIAVICAVLVPLGLYAFFAHVAGVGIPQGNFVRLP